VAKQQQQSKSMTQYSFTRAEALRTMPIWILAFDNFSCAIIGAGCSQVLLQVLRENGADTVVRAQCLQRVSILHNG
jgi:hypothetical protein